MILDVLEGEVDIAVAPLTVLESRSRVVDFLLPVMEDFNTFIIRRESSFNWKIFFKELLSDF